MVPIMIVESDFGSKKVGPVAKQLEEQFGCKNVGAVIIKRCGHYIPEEGSEKLYEIIRNNTKE